MITSVIINWKDVNDKDLTNSSKYTTLNDNYQVNTIDQLNAAIASAPSTVEAFIKRSGIGYPSEDVRLVVIESTYAPADEQDSEFPGYRVWKRNYSVVPRSNADIKASIDECCKNANIQVYPTDRRVQHDHSYSVFARRESLGATLTDTEKEIMERTETYVQLMVQNEEIAKAKKQAVDDGIPFDLDADWIKDDPYAAV